ncbi:short-chain dehydrogenase [Gordonia spumicola]|uniref:Short-chain dehydrogenase n=1 Tax=Gordonia spumicola TaxID=589161 RepID=A0A7I9V548_9ACTN|nr:SDR family oxidoreductase [Gordonia spumicola]GEE00539.1 short-chain dehydrogenase [Gordonia spumicola]
MNVLVIGGSRGLGRAVAAGLAVDGGIVFINNRALDRETRETVLMVEAAGARAVPVPGDVSTPDGARTVLDAVKEHTDRIDVLVHSAVAGVPTRALNADADDLRHVTEVNALSVLYVVQQALPLLGAGSSVVYLSSRGARIALPHYVTVGASKAMGEALIRYLSVELAEIGARANVVAPTALDTPGFREIFGDDADRRLAIAGQRSPSGRAVDCDDVVDVVKYLASPGASMVQGQTIVLDGGSLLVG